MSKCQHKHSTLTRGYLDEGDPVAVHQCDNCGVALPKIQPVEVDIWTLPEFDSKASERGYTKIFEYVFEYISQKAENAINFVKAAKYEQRNVR